MYYLDKQIGLGTFPFSGVFSSISQKEAEEIVKEFVSLGGHYIETAPIYPRGNVNLSDIIKLFNREELLIGTKCVLSLDKGGNTVSSGKESAIRDHCYSEMERLGVDYLDLLETHVTATDAKPSDVSQALNRLKKEGLVRYIGVSNASPSDIISYVSGGNIDFVQNRYSVIHRSPTDSITEICRNNNILFNPYQVIERGQLINKNAGEWRDGDLRAKKSEYVGDVFERVHSWAINSLGNIAVNAGLSLEELSIRWTFSNSQVAVPVVGATKKWQVKKNMSVKLMPLPNDVISAIEHSYTEFSNELQRLFGLSIEEFRGLV